MIDIYSIEKTNGLKGGLFFIENSVYEYFTCKEIACKKFRNKKYIYVAIPFFENRNIIENHLKAICNSFACKLEIVTISEFSGRSIKYLVAKISEGQKVVDTHIGVDFLFLKIKHLFNCSFETETNVYNNISIPFGSLFKYNSEFQINYLYYTLMNKFNLESDTILDIPYSKFEKITETTGLFSLLNQSKMHYRDLYQTLYDKIIGNYVLEVNFKGKPEDKELFLDRVRSIVNIHYSRAPSEWIRWKLNGCKFIETNVTQNLVEDINGNILGYRGAPYVKKD